MERLFILQLNRGRVDRRRGDDGGRDAEGVYVDEALRKAKDAELKRCIGRICCHPKYRVSNQTNFGQIILVSHSGAPNYYCSWFVINGAH